MVTYRCINLSVYVYVKKRKKRVTGISFCRLPKISETPRLGSRLISCRSGATNEACWGSTAVLWHCYSGLTPVDLSYINAPVFTVKSECTLTWGPSIRPAISCYETCKEHSTGESIKHGQMSAWNTDTLLPFSFFFLFFLSLIWIWESAGDWEWTFTVTVPQFCYVERRFVFFLEQLMGLFSFHSHVFGCVVSSRKPVRQEWLEKTPL